MAVIATVIKTLLRCLAKRAANFSKELSQGSPIRGANQAIARRSGASSQR
jgi:hypothetical protein